MHRSCWLPSRAAALLFSGILLLEGVSPVQAFEGDFLFQYYDGLPQLYLADGTFVHEYGEDLIGHGPDYIGYPIYTETVDAFTLSADRQEVYVFGNDLGAITNFAFDVDTGDYLGTRGINQSLIVSQQWEEGFESNFGIGHPFIRTDDPSGSGDLFYIGAIGITPGNALVNVVDTSTGDVTTQILLPSPADIHDIALGPGTNGPQSRVFLGTEDGTYAYEELFAGFFQLVSPAPLTAAVGQFGNMEIGPDGYLYLLEDYTSYDIQRYDSQTGAFVDTFLSDAEEGYSAEGYDFREMRFGPGGDLYLLFVGLSPGPGENVRVYRYDVDTGHRRAEYNLGFVAGGLSVADFIVLHDPIPEPASAALLLIGAVLLLSRRRRRA